MVRAVATETTAEQATRNSRPEVYGRNRSTRAWMHHDEHAEADMGAYESARISDNPREAARLRRSLQQLHAGEVLWDDLPPPTE